VDQKRKGLAFFNNPGKEATEKNPTLLLSCSCCSKRREEKLPSQFTAPPSPFLPAIKTPSPISVFSLPQKKG
jgi:hypothetical protein